MIHSVPISAQENNLAYNTATSPVIPDAIQNGMACNKLVLNRSLCNRSYTRFNRLRIALVSFFIIIFNPVTKKNTWSVSEPASDEVGSDRTYPAVGGTCMA